MHVSQFSSSTHFVMADWQYLGFLQVVLGTWTRWQFVIIESCMMCVVKGQNATALVERRKHVATVIEGKGNIGI
jgi:hypothetical protein